MNEDQKGLSEMKLRDKPAETENGMLLSVLADEPGEAESAMFLNSLVDDPEALKRDAERFIRAVDQARDEMERED